MRSRSVVDRPGRVPWSISACPTQVTPVRSISNHVQDVEPSSSRRPEPGLGKFKRRPLGDEGAYIAVPEPGRMYLAGTTIPAVGAKYVQRPDGLLVPQALARAPQPLDLIRTYVTYSELFGYPPPSEYVVEALGAVPRTEFVRGVAGLLGVYERIGASRPEIDRALADRWFKEPAIGLIRGLLGERATLVAPQTLLLLMQFALVRSHEVPDADATPHPLPALILAVQEGLGGIRDADESNVFTGDTRSALFRQVVAGHHFGSTDDEATTMAHHHQRWSHLSGTHAGDPRAVDLSKAFHAATGVEKDDFTAVGLAIWAHCETHHSYPIPAAAFDSFNLAPEVVRDSLALMSRSVEEFRSLILAIPTDFQTEWSFDILRRFPLLRLDDGSVLVLSKNLLIDRIYGWLPLFDVIEGLKSARRRKDADRVEGWFRHLCELDALENIRSLAGSRLYAEDAIQSAFGTAVLNADAVIEYPDAFVVVEIGTRQLSRSTVVATTPEGLEADLKRGVDEKAAQLDATITELIADESRLTGRPARARRRYLAVLVLTEGFPVNPMTSTAIRERLAASGLLADPRIGPLHVIDQEELDMAEAIAEGGGPSFLELLEQHEPSNLGSSSFKDWLILERGAGAGPRRPTRLEALRQDAWQPAIDRLRKPAGGAAEE